MSFSCVFFGAFWLDPGEGCANMRAPAPACSLARALRALAGGLSKERLGRLALLGNASESFPKRSRKPPRAHFGPPGAPFRPPGAHFDPPKGNLGPPGAHFDPPGALLALPGRSRDPLGSPLGPPKSLPEALPEASRAGARFWGHFGVHFGSIFGPPKP